MTRSPRLMVAGLAAVLALVAGCADPARIPAGTSRADVLQKVGKPTSVYAMGASRVTLRPPRR